MIETMFLDGRASSLEEQATLPILNLIEVRHPPVRKKRGGHHW
ncbi:MAG: hypothetical protein FJ147_15770 [Deltaproteobacteria bacterium]|nr:hypothetical protein [Deltaproteobacteria bacterium]